MQINSFEKLLISALDNSDSIRTQAGNVINEIKENDYQCFLNLILQTTSISENPTSIYIAFSLILCDIRNNKLLNDNIFTDFFNNFKIVIVQMFHSNRFNEAICNILSAILTYIAINNQSVNVPDFLINELFLNDSFKPFVLDTLSSIYFQTCCKQPLNIFSHLLEGISSDINAFNLQFKLLSSILSHFVEEEHIHQLFIKYMNSIPGDSIIYVLELFSDNMKCLIAFFQYHIIEILHFLFHLLDNDDERIVFQSCDCLVKFTVLFQEYDEFEKILSDVLFALMNILENRQQFEEIGLISIRELSENIEQYSFIQKLDEIKCGKNFNSSYLLSLSELSPCCCYYMIDKTTYYFNEILQLILYDYQKYLKDGLLAIENLCDILSPAFQDDNFKELFRFLSKLIFENINNFEIAMLSLSCTSLLLSKVTIKISDEITNQEFSDFYNFLMSLLLDLNNNCIIKLKPIIIDVLENFIKVLANQFSQFIPSFLQILSSLLSTDKIDVMVAIIRFSDTCITKIGKKIEDKSTFLPFFQIALSLRGQVENEIDFDYISHSIITFINFLGDSIQSTLIDIVPIFISIASKDIEITHFPENVSESINEVSGFRKVSPYDFAKISTIREIAFALITINSSLRSLKEKYNQFLDSTVELIKKWIGFPFLIDEVKQASYFILNQLIQFDFNINTNFLYSLYVSTPQDSKKATKYIVNSIENDINKNKLDLNVISNLLQFYTEILNAQLQNENSSENSFLSYFFKFCMKKIQPIALPFYKNVIVPSFSSLINCESTLLFILKTIPIYIKYSHDFDFILDFLEITLTLLNDTESEEAQIAMESLGKLCDSKILENNPIHNNYIKFFHIIFQKICEILKFKESFENDSLIFLNESIVSFTKMIQLYILFLQPVIPNFDIDEALKLWLDSLPYLFNNSKNSKVTKFLSFLLVNKTNEMINLFGVANLTKLLISFIGKQSIDKPSLEIFAQFLKSVLLNSQAHDIIELSESEYAKLQALNMYEKK